MTSATRTENRILTRREVIQTAFVALGTALASTQVAGAHPFQNHLAHPDTLLDAGAKIAGDNWTPKILDAQQDETLIILSERILPGSGAAQVNRLIDLLLTVETAENRDNFVAAIAALDVQARKRFGRPVKSLNPAEQDELLILSSTMKPARVAHDRDSSSSDAMDRGPVPGATLRDHFENLKGWIVGAYYASETGMRELGWTEETYFDALPECSHLEEHR
jgi:hypothetical protein